MTRTILMTLTAVTLTLGTLAPANASQLRDHLKHELPTYGFKNVDVDGLTSTQVAHIRHLLHSNKSPAQIRGNIGAILGKSAIKLFKK